MTLITIHLKMGDLNPYFSLMSWETGRLEDWVTQANSLFTIHHPPIKWIQAKKEKKLSPSG